MTKSVSKILLSAVVAAGLAGCASYGMTDTKPAAGVKAVAKPKPASEVMVTEGDITDRKYRVLGEVSARVNKTTILNKNPTREMVAERLKKAAAKLGADAVIQVRYGTVGVSLLSWGSLTGKGRAVAFVQ